MNSYWSDRLESKWCTLLRVECFVMFLNDFLLAWPLAANTMDVSVEVWKLLMTDRFSSSLYEANFLSHPNVRPVWPQKRLRIGYFSPENYTYLERKNIWYLLQISYCLYELHGMRVQSAINLYSAFKTCFPFIWEYLKAQSLQLRAWVMLEPEVRWLITASKSCLNYQRERSGLDKKESLLFCSCWTPA